MLLSELLSPSRIKIPLQSVGKDELLRELVSIVFDTSTNGGDEVLRAVQDRESVLSTGIGNGVAIPHGKSAAVPELRMAAGLTRESVDFDALDGQPVKLFFLLVGPESAAGAHIKALSRISRLVRKDSVRDRLMQAASAQEFFDVLREAEGA